MSNDLQSAERAPAEPDLTAELKRLRGESLARSARRDFMASIYTQSFWIACGYLLIGILTELGRGRLHFAETASRFIDTLPLAVIRHTGLLEPYLRWVIMGELTPFWNRALLSSIGVGIIFVQASLVAVVVAILQWMTAPRK